MKLLLGSNNRHKQSELQAIFDKEMPGSIDLLIPDDVLSEKIEVDETGNTFEENAYLKAKAFNDASGIPTFAEDTGLEIDALNGEPGIFSARYSGEHGNDSANRKKVLELMIDIPPEGRTARFRTVICLIINNKVEYLEGICAGKIIYDERGTNGFGYDPIFMPDGYDMTFAEMPSELKNSISHRNKAALNLINCLKSLKVLKF
jgi:XTP/dITP diphosphohydrolase